MIPCVQTAVVQRPQRELCCLWICASSSARQQIRGWLGKEAFRTVTTVPCSDSSRAVQIVPSLFCFQTIVVLQQQELLLTTLYYCKFKAFTLITAVIEQHIWR